MVLVQQKRTTCASEKLRDVRHSTVAQDCEPLLSPSRETKKVVSARKRPPFKDPVGRGASPTLPKVPTRTSGNGDASLPERQTKRPSSICISSDEEEGLEIENNRAEQGKNREEKNMVPAVLRSVSDEEERRGRSSKTGESLKAAVRDVADSNEHAGRDAAASAFPPLLPSHGAAGSQAKLQEQKGHPGPPSGVQRPDDAGCKASKRGIGDGDGDNGEGKRAKGVSETLGDDAKYGSITEQCESLLSVSREMRRLLSSLKTSPCGNPSASSSTLPEDHTLGAKVL